MRRRPVLFLSLALATVGFVVACENSPTKPSPLSASPLAGIDVIGPDSVPPGESAQLVANIRQADGTTKSASNVQTVSWRSSDSSVMLVNNTGLITARPSARGEAMITAAVNTPAGVVQGTRVVVAQPQGTYRIVGSVHESGAPTVPVAGALVEVRPESRAAVTDDAGQFRFYGLSPQSSIRVTAVGYETIDQPLELTANATRDFGLTADGPRLVLNGPYTIAVDVVSSCNLDSALQHRTYNAVLTTTGTVIDVALTEQRYALADGRGNHFKGRLSGGGATFTLEDYDWPDYMYPNVVERLEDNTRLVVAGEATIEGTAAGLTGTLSGFIYHADSRFPAEASFLGACGGTDIQFRITSRPDQIGSATVSRRHLVLMPVPPAASERRLYVAPTPR